MACTTLGDLNVTDCDADPNIQSGMADVCIKVLTVVKMGQMGQMTMNMFSCGMKVSKTKISSRHFGVITA